MKNTALAKLNEVIDAVNSIGRVTDNEISVYRTLNEAKIVLKRLQTKTQITALEQKD